MGRQGKAPVVVLAVISGVSLVVAVGTYVAKVQEHNHRVAIERQLKQTQAAKEALEGDLKESQAAKAKLEDQVASLKWEAQSLTTQLEDEKKAKDELTRAISDKQAQMDQLTQTLEKERGDRSALNEQLAKAQSDVNALQQQLEQVKEAKAVLEERLAKTSDKAVDLQKVVVNKAEAAAKSLAGQVQVINREFDFLVVNLGRNNGVQVGQLFEVYRDNDVLGHVKVEKVYDALSACAFQPDVQKDQLREGDRVRSL